MSYTLPVNEINRLENLYSYNILDTLPEETFEAITKIASTICKTPISAISFIDKNRQWFKSIIGVDVKETSRDISFCTHTILEKEILIVENTLNDDRFSNNPFVLNEPNIRFYAGVPLKTKDGFNLGSICVIDTIPRNLSSEQIELLHSLSTQVVTLIELKKTVKSLENKKANLKILLENTDNSIWSVDKKHNLISFNSEFKKKFEEYFNIAPEIGQNLDKYAHLQGNEYWLPLYNRALSGEKFTIEQENIFNDKITYREISFNPVVIDNEVVAITNFSKDITDRKLKDLKLIKSENTFKTAFDYSPIGMTLFSPEGICLKVNKAFCNMLGYTEDELLKVTFRDVTHPDDLEENIVLVNQLFEGKIKSFKKEKRYIHKNGNIIWGSVNATLVNDNLENPIYFIVQIQDITEKKVSELKLLFNSNILQNVKDCVIVSDLDGNITYWNHGASAIFGYSEKEILGQKVTILYPEDYLTTLDTSLKSIASGNSYNSEWKGKAKDGSYVWLDLKTTTFQDKEGEIIGFIGVSKDITEKKKTQEDLIKTKDLLEKSLKIKSDFLSVISHEIRTPMNGIVGMTELLLNTKLETEQSEFVQIIKKSGNVLLSVINDILDISKIESGNIELEKKPFEIKACIEDIFDSMVTKIKERPIELVYYVSPDVPKFVIGDVNKIRQIMINLIDNGLKFTEKGELYFSVEVAEKNAAKIFLRFTVRDSGIGMSNNNIEELFQPFSKADASASRKYGGAGLGLAISKNLITLMDGDISVKSKIAHGSEFTFTLALDISVATSKNDFQGGKIKLLNKKALIIDDNATSIQVLDNYLHNWNMLTTTTQSPVEALNKIKNESFDIIIIDKDMPEMDGIALAIEIRKTHSTDALPIILLTYLVNPIENTEQNKHLISAYIDKPIKESVLFDKLTDILSKKIISPIKENTIDEGFASNYPTKILLAEDNLINQKLAVKMLGKMGYSVDIANNGLETIEAIKKQKYDLIFMDVQMPEMDGLEATKYIVNNFPDRPVIVALTANAMHGDREICLNAGMDDYLSKPVSIQYLKNTLIKWSKVNK